MMGINIIGEMSKEDLIHEILAYHRAKLLDTEVTELKVTVINLRMEDYRKALVTEAGLKLSNDNFMGSRIVDDE